MRQLCKEGKFTQSQFVNRDREKEPSRIHAHQPYWLLLPRMERKLRSLERNWIFISKSVYKTHKTPVPYHNHLIINASWTVGAYQRKEGGTKRQLKQIHQQNLNLNIIISHHRQSFDYVVQCQTIIITLVRFIQCSFHTILHIPLSSCSVNFTEHNSKGAY